MSVPTTDKQRDEFFLVRCQLGEHSALEELVSRFDARLRAYLIRMIAGATDDLRQEVWLQVFRSIGHLREADRLDAWFFTIARRVVMNHLRRRYRRGRRTRALPTDLIAPHDETPRFELDPILSELPIEEREAVTLFYLLGRSGAVVAGVQGIPEATVRSRLARARRRMADTLNTREEGEAS